MLGGSVNRVQHRWSVILLGVLTLLLTFVPVPSSAQNSAPSSVQGSSGNNATPAAVVVDGQVLFEVKNSGNFAAAERAQIINKALEDEVRSNGAVDIEVIPEKEKIIIRSRTSDRILVTMAEADVIPGNQPLAQAKEWERSIEQALRRSKLERTSTYYNQALLFSVGVLLGAIAFHVALHFLGKFLSHQVRRWLGDSTLALNPQVRSAKLFLQLGFVGLQVGLWIAVAFYVTDTLPDARSWRYKLFKVLTSPVVTLGEVNYSALQVLQLIALTVGLWFGVSALTRLFKSYVLVKTGAEAGVQDVIAVLTQYVLAFLGMIVLLQSSGLDLRSLAIFASVVGVGIGFGTQNIANNLISGLILTLERPIKVGDFVKVGEQMGTVKRIGARSTEIYTLDQVSIIVPNSRFLESEVVNWSYGDPVSRLLIPAGVAYGSNIQHVQAALLEAARSHPEVLVRPQPQVWFLGFGDSSLNFDLRVWVGDPKKQFRIKSDLYYRIEASFRRYNIEVPFPQHDLNLRSPGVEQFIATWLQQNGSKSQVNTGVLVGSDSRLHSPNGDEQSIQPQEPPVLTSEVPMSEGTLGTALGEKLAGIDIDALVTAMRGAQGVEIKDRRHRMNIYPRCFVGSEAVEWLIQTQNCTREEAIDIGQLLVDRGIIHDVVDEHPFRDEYLFYRFYADEQ
ncbi:MAG: mechanosensitive ion channel [Coleofasciculus sp. Co-bin14]|nr:mechanosensitive ion channel [Coleofasciculus sp. Co-bin14]